MPTSGKNLGDTVARGAVWMMLMRFAARGLGIVSTAILARLLTPADFGIMAIAMSFIALMGLFSQFGFDAVLIQKQNASDADYNTAWTLNLGFAVFAGAGLAVCASFIAGLYEDPRLEPVLYWMSLLFVLTGGQNIGVVNFRKNLEWRREFIFATVPRFIGFAVTVPLALVLGNYWALVFGTLGLRLATNVMSYTMQPFRPRPSLASFSELFHFSKWLVIRNSLIFVNLRAPELIVGKLISAPAAGFISLAKELPNTGVVETVGTINRATYPGYAKISHDLPRLRALYAKVLASVSLYVLPASIGLAWLADPVVPLFLGDQWLPCIPLVQIMSLAGALMAMNSNTTYVFLAVGDARMPTLVSLVRVLVLVPGLLLGTHWAGLLGASYGVLLAGIATNVTTTAIMRRRIGIGTAELFNIHKRPALGCGCMVIALGAFDAWLPGLVATHPVLYLGAAMGLGGAVFAAVVALLWWADGMQDGAEAKILEQGRALLAKLR
ncbi:MAG: lipopolysaccharide biosynthesis protein [Gammaproteobacteria bacterium]